MSAWELSAASATTLAREGAARGHRESADLGLMESEVLSCHRRTVVVSSWSTPCPSLVLASSLSLRG